MQGCFQVEELMQLKNASQLQTTTEIQTDFLFIKSNKKTIKIKFSDIYYIEGLGDYIQIHLESQKIVTNLTMKKIISLLPENSFYRIHKSFIISLDKIDLIEGNMVQLKKKKLPVGNSYRHDFMEFINHYLAE